MPATDRLDSYRIALEAIERVVSHARGGEGLEATALERWVLDYVRAVMAAADSV